ncbi:MAG: hypothetical protein LQ342_005867 [Letrouitia transgressa]|nr:MAG: hypothetical protein LQ342_005867 [Letrouitia transgressa]
MKGEAASDEEPNSIDENFDDLDKLDHPASLSNNLNKSLVGMWSGNSARSVGSNTPLSNGLPPSPAPTSKKRNMNGEPLAKRRKATQGVDRSPPTHVRLADLGGVETIVEELEDLIVLPLLEPSVYMTSKIQPPRGILLHGPPGCGKTMIANAFAAEIGVPFISLSAPSIVSGMSGESEKALRDHFEEAKSIAPCIIFIDEIDAITPKRESAQREMEKRIVAQLLTCMDELALEKTGGKAVIVLAATNRPDSLDPALRRGGRFDKEINLGVPDESMREKILRTLTREMPISEELDFSLLAKSSPGFVGADLNDLVSTAGSAAIKRYRDSRNNETHNMEPDHEPSSLSLRVSKLRRLIQRDKGPKVVQLTNKDFLTALPKIQPSSKREGFATIPDTTWMDIGALQTIREELITAIVEPIKSPEKYERVGITTPTGVLLWGPPGCGKTLLAKAVANESRANFISVKGPELLNKYVGESERAVRQVFLRARSSVPCVIFFDEIEGLIPKRNDTLSESSARVVNTFQTELDGLSNRQGIYVIGATNRPDKIDEAMLRPGRLETLLFVDLPGEQERVEILQTLSRDVSIIYTEEIAGIARRCQGFSGADLKSLLRRAGYSAMKRNGTIELQDFINAKKKIQPSVNNRTKYERLKQRFGSGVD